CAREYNWKLNVW
nr:immunoglobulin heavy chain junction region [Macaca mulatta]